MFSRAMRRHHYFRLRIKRKGYYGGVEQRKESVREKVLGIWADTATVCSCHMCGNARKHFKLKTWKEYQCEEISLDEDDY